MKVPQRFKIRTRHTTPIVFNTATDSILTIEPIDVRRKVHRINRLIASKDQILRKLIDQDCRLHWNVNKITLNELESIRSCPRQGTSRNYG